MKFQRKFEETNSIHEVYLFGFIKIVFLGVDFPYDKTERSQYDVRFFGFEYYSSPGHCGWFRMLKFRDTFLFSFEYTESKKVAFLNILSKKFIDKSQKPI